MKIGLVAPVKHSQPYLKNDPAPLLDLHHLRISPWLWFRFMNCHRVAGFPSWSINRFAPQVQSSVSSLHGKDGVHPLVACLVLVAVGAVHIHGLVLRWFRRAYSLRPAGRGRLGLVGEIVTERNGSVKQWVR